MRHVIIGYGEVGKALHRNLIGDIAVFDKGDWENLEVGQFSGGGADQLVHICLPYSEEFLDLCVKAQGIFLHSMIIHSTVPPGTTKQLVRFSYSPTLGRHADGFSGNMLNYAKPFSGEISTFVRTCSRGRVSSLGSGLRRTSGVALS